MKGGAAGLDVGHHGAGDLVHVADAAAARRDGDAHAGPDALAHAGAPNLVKDGLFDVLPVDVGVRELLGRVEHARAAERP